MILSSSCDSLKFFSYSLNHQDKLAFICSLSLISASSLPFSISPQRPALFITTTVWSELWSFLHTEALTKRAINRAWDGEDLLFLDCIVLTLIIAWSVLSVVLILSLLSLQLFELRREEPEAHKKVLLSHCPFLPVTADKTRPAY